eukprot:m.159586 g.159586  ORF g.159586 m.159586 type:complete len:553 (+) comp18007_c0_seq12:143-1801(+)
MFIREAHGHALAIACTACLMYCNTLDGSFVFDDNPAITENADCDPLKSDIHDVWQNNFWGQKMASPTAQHASYRPVTTLTFRANTWLHGMNPWGFHVTNVMLHSVASILFYFVALEIHGSDTPRVVSLLAALLFAVHPVHAEAVANIVGRSEVLSCIFMFASFLSYARGCQGQSTNAFWMALCYICTTVAVLCKEQGITILAVCVVYDIMCLSAGDPLKVFLELDSEYVYQELLDEKIQQLRAKRLSPSDVLENPTKKNSGSHTEASDGQQTSDHASDDQSYSKQKTLPHPCENEHNAVPTKYFDPIPRIAVYVFVVGCVVQQRLLMNGDETFTVDEKTNPANHIEDFKLRTLTKGFYVTLHGWYRVLFLRGVYYVLVLSNFTATHRQMCPLLKSNWYFQCSRLLVFPYELCCDWSSYGIVNIESYRDVRIAAVALCAGVTIYLCWLALDISGSLPRVLRAKLATGIALVVFPFIPASGLLLEVGFVVAERVLYVPCAGWCFLLSLWAWHTWTRHGRGATGGDDDAVGVWTPRHALVAACVVLLLSYSATLW